jgi:hypothetical protein
MKNTIKNWIEQNSKQRKEKEKQLLKDSIIQYLLLDLSTAESLEIKEETDRRFKEIMEARLERVNKEKQQIENWLNERK